jgi:hypothetical protein
MPLSPEQEALCERVEKGNPSPAPKRSSANKPTVLKERARASLTVRAKAVAG